MPGEIKLNYDEVYSRASALQYRLENALSNMEDEYSQLEPALAQSDGKANAALIETIIANQEKSRIAAMTLHKLLSFMSNSTLRMQETDMGIGSIGDGFSIRGRKEGGD